MYFPAEKVESRREFFRATARYGLLALLSAAAVVLGRKTSLQRCVNRGICSGCGEFASCGLPPALSAKEAKRQG